MGTLRLLVWRGLLTELLPAERGCPYAVCSVRPAPLFLRFTLLDLLSRRGVRVPFMAATKIVVTD